MDIGFPPLFAKFLGFFSIASLDFLSLECILGEASDQFTSLIIYSLAPVATALAIVAVYAYRADNVTSESSLQRLKSTHVYYLLLLTYLVLPPVTLKQFQALDCVRIAHGSYLRVDTSVSCLSAKYGVTRVVNGLFLALYLGVPPLWLVLLYRERVRLNPPTTDRKLAYFLRDNDKSLEALRFLFKPYLPSLCVLDHVPMLFVWQCDHMCR